MEPVDFLLEEQVVVERVKVNLLRCLLRAKEMLVDLGVFSV